MATPSPTYLDPINNSQAWHYFTLQGLRSPGSIPRGGVRGFKRETGWEERKGKGTKGATLALVSAPPCRGTITLQFFQAQDFATNVSHIPNWDAFVNLVLSIDPAKQTAEGLAIYYPGFASIGLTQVVVKSYSPPEHKGRGLYTVEIELIEWVPPPAVNITSTVAATATDVEATKPAKPLTEQQVQYLANQALIKQLYAKASGQPPLAQVVPLT